MNAPRATAEDYVPFLIGSPKAVSATEAPRVQPDRPAAPALDAFTRLQRLEPEPQALWDEARPLIDPATGVLVIDDSTLDKPRAKHIALVGHHWSGNHHRVMRGSTSSPRCGPTTTDSTPATTAVATRPATGR